jgi:hypothetical protein
MNRTITEAGAIFQKVDERKDVGIRIAVDDLLQYFLGSARHHEPIVDNGNFHSIS